MKRLKFLEDENAKLRKIVADLSLDREMLQDVIRRKLLACSAAQAGWWGLQLVEYFDPAGLQGL
jgi:putative transposase